jgi:hypothetical protein
VSSGDDDVPPADTSDAKPHVPAGDDAEGEGASSAKSIALGLISSNAPVQAEPSIADRVTLGAPSASGHKRKRPRWVPKRKQTKSSADQVMTQI